MYEMLCNLLEMNASTGCINARSTLNNGLDI